MQKFIIPVLTASVLALTCGLAFAQSGSTGGTIGNTNKSVSGEDESRAPARRARNRAPAKRSFANTDSLPQTIKLSEHYSSTFTITLEKVNGNLYEGTFNHGIVTRFNVTKFTKESLEMKRIDLPTFGAVTGTYTGSRTGNSANGQAPLSNGYTVRWQASW